MASVMFVVDLAVFVIVIACVVSLLGGSGKRRDRPSSPRWHSYVDETERDIHGSQFENIRRKRDKRSSA
jgi:hypothetical protein